MKVGWRKKCRLYRLALYCSIYKFTQGECDTCGHLIKKKIIKKYGKI